MNNVSAFHSRTVGDSGSPNSQGISRIPQSAFIQLPSLTDLALGSLDTSPQDLRNVFLPMVQLQRLYVLCRLRVLFAEAVCVVPASRLRHVCTLHLCGSSAPMVVCPAYMLLVWEVF